MARTDETEEDQAHRLLFGARAAAHPSEAARIALQRRAEAEASARADAVRAAAAVPTIYAWRGRRVAVHPISNSLPDHLFVSHVPDKARAIAENLPGNASTYGFATEAAYYAHYRRSLFGVTRKKTGWDAVRAWEPPEQSGPACGLATCSSPRAPRVLPACAASGASS